MKNRTKSRWKKIVLGIGLFLAVLVIGLTIFIKNSTYQATDSALKISQSATQEKNYDYYTNGQKNDTALIFYRRTNYKGSSTTKLRFGWTFSGWCDG